jgi:hypothetical protein
MIARFTVSLKALVAISVVIAVWAEIASAQQAKPNILVIFVDDIGTAQCQRV